MTAKVDMITDRLRQELAATEVHVTDESELHRGHAGWRPEGNTHFRVRVVTDQFDGLSRVARHRLVYAALADELAGSMHALAIHCLTPAEAAG